MIMNGIKSFHSKHSAVFFAFIAFIAVTIPVNCTLDSNEISVVITQENSQDLVEIDVQITFFSNASSITTVVIFTDEAFNGSFLMQRTNITTWHVVFNLLPGNYSLTFLASRQGVPSYYPYGSVIVENQHNNEESDKQQSRLISRFPSYFLVTLILSVVSIVIILFQVQRVSKQGSSTGKSVGILENLDIDGSNWFKDD
ncbi:MAG: hypothetical protein ACFFD4_33760 [Candidatus Odinarchaeota archaeon]